MIKRILSIFSIVLCGTGSFAQPVPNANLENQFGPSINAGQGNGAGNIGVDKYTGNLQLGMSLFKYENPSTGLSHSISISYKGGGITVDEVASNIGLGWSLFTGGVITRNINSLPDEHTHGFSNMGAVDDAASPDPENLRSFAANGSDGQFDEYYFSAGNFSGKFVIGKNGQILQIPASNAKIEKITGSYSPTSAAMDSCITISFKITLPDGTKYVYSNFDCSKVDFGDGLTSGSTYNVYASSTWYLSKIVAAFNKDSIVFNYTPTILNYTGSCSYTEYIYNASTTSTPYYLGYSNVAGTICRSRQMTLSNIEYPNGTVVTFNYDAFNRIDVKEDHAINNIIIANDAQNYGYKFNYFYVNATGPVTVPYADYSGTTIYHEARMRLMLDNYVVFSGTDTLPQYKFGFNSFIPVGRGAFNNVDDWGYYSSIADDRIPSLPGSSYANSRESNITNEASSISNITLPTGGKIKVEYENNTNVENPVTLLETTSGTMYGNIIGDPIGTSEKHIIPASPTPTVQCIVTATPLTAWPSGWASTDTLYFCLAKATGTSLSIAMAGPYVYKQSIIKFSKAEFLAHTPKTVIFNTDVITYALVLFRKDASSYYNYDGLGLNVYWKTYSGPPSATVGGIRVKKLIQSDGTGHDDVTREFKYVEEDGITSSGLIAGHPVYTFKYSEVYNPVSGSTTHPSLPIATPYDLLGHYVNPSIAPSSSTTNDYIVYSGAALNSMALAHGNPVGYRRVEEYLGTSTNFQLKTVYQFTDEFSGEIGDIYPSIISGNKNGFPFAPHQSIDFAAGLLKSVCTYNASYQQISRTINEYDIFLQPYNDNNFRGIKTGVTKYGDGTVVAGNYKTQNYYPITGKVFAVKTLETSFYDGLGNDTIQHITQNIYDTSKLILRKTITADGRGAPMETRLYYPLDFSITGAISTLQSNGMKYFPIRSETWKDILSPSPYMVSAYVSSFQQLPDGLVKPQSRFALTVSDPVTSAAWGSFDNTVLLPHAELFTQGGSADLYDSKGNLLQSTSKGISTSTIWGYNKHFPVASIANARYQDVAYTSFEEEDLGNWSSTGAIGSASVGSSITGNRLGLLASGVSLTRNGLDPSKTYQVSFWASSTVPSVNTVSGTVPVTASDSHRGMTIYRATFSGSSFVNVTNPGGVMIPLDELRLHPADAMMTTNTYSPLQGNVTSKCDASNRNIYYEYDKFGRLKVVRDIDGNILKKHDYQIQEAQY